MTYQREVPILIAELRSVVVVSQISSIDKGRLGLRIGQVTEQRVEQILDGLRFLQASFFEPKER